MPSVGEILAAERRRQGKSLNDVVEGTKIRSRLIDALEAGRYDDLPSPAYVKGYIQSYARYLEIPSEPLLDQFRLEASSIERIARPIDSYLDIPHETIVPAREKAHAIPRQVWLVTAAVVLAAGLLICGLTRLFTGGTAPMPTKPSSSEATGSPGVGEGATTTVNTTEDGFKLRVTALEGQGSWMRVTVDGLQGFEGTLQNGESREWLVTDNVVLNISKPAALVVARDGKRVSVPRTGDMSQLTLKVGH